MSNLMENEEDFLQFMEACGESQWRYRIPSIEFEFEQLPVCLRL